MIVYVQKKTRRARPKSYITGRAMTLSGSNAPKVETNGTNYLYEAERRALAIYGLAIIATARDGA